MLQWIPVTLSEKDGLTPRHIGIKVWAENLDDSFAIAKSIIDNDKWVPISAGPARQDINHAID